MNKVYVLGPIHLFGKSYIPVYKELSAVCRKHFDKVLCTYPDFWNFKGTPAQFYKITRRKITDCDLFIAEVTSPSTGVGMELQMAVENKIPVMALVKHGHKASSMVLGLPVLTKVIEYKTVRDLTLALDKALGRNKRKVRSVQGSK